jgi:hypothetical protein
MLPPRALTVAGIGGTWNIVRVRSRCEKSLAADLLEAGIDYFLPLLKSKDRFGRVAYSPLEALKGFLFTSTPQTPPEGYFIPPLLQDFLSRHHAFYGFVQTSLSGQARLVTELEQIYSGIVEKRIKVGVSVVKGAKCEVTSGPYRGCVGVVDRVLKKGWAIIDMKTLNQMIPVEVELKDLEPVSPE